MSFVERFEQQRSALPMLSRRPLAHTPMRLRPFLPAVLGALIVATACSVDVTAPSSLTASRGIAASSGANPGHDGQLNGNGGRPTSRAYSVIIDPTRRNLVHFGRHTLLIPAGALCGVQSSGYGLAVFDESCSAETEPVAIEAAVSSDARGLPRIILGPRLRFSPSATVVLSMYVGHEQIQQATSWRVLYCAGNDFEHCVDESILDPSLAAHVDYARGTVYRQIRHFSGYYVEY